MIYLRVRKAFRELLGACTVSGVAELPGTAVSAAVSITPHSFGGDTAKENEVNVLHGLEQA